MKSVIKVCLVILIIILLSPIAFAMGGPPEEVSQENPSQSGTAPAVQSKPSQSKSDATPEELNKATLELVKLEAKLERVEDYLDKLSMKIIKARVDGDGNKVIELKARESEFLGQKKILEEKIARIKEKYPELREQQLVEVHKLTMGGQKPTQEVMQGAASIEVPQRPTASKIIYHEVGMGDSLMSISRQYFNTPIYYKEIARMNNITDLGYVPQGTRLMIDMSIAGKAPMPAEAQKKELVKPAAETIIFHVVAHGDTLMSISRRYYGSSEYFRDIASLNGLTAFSQLRIGMKLKIDKNLKSKVIVVPQL